MAALAKITDAKRGGRTFLDVIIPVSDFMSEEAKSRQHPELNEGVTKFMQIAKQGDKVENHRCLKYIGNSNQLSNKNLPSTIFDFCLKVCHV